jgi:hypothetical protein
LEQLSDQTISFPDQPDLSGAQEPQSPVRGKQNSGGEQTFYWLDDTGIQILRATRSWIQYGTLGFAVCCILIGAVEGLLGR